MEVKVELSDSEAYKVTMKYMEETLESADWFKKHYKELENDPDYRLSPDQIDERDYWRKLGKSIKKFKKLLGEMETF